MILLEITQTIFIVNNNIFNIYIILFILQFCYFCINNFIYIKTQCVYNYLI